MTALRVGIDASNLRDRGGVTHLYQLLGAADPASAGVGEVTVWGSRATLDRLAPRPWLTLSRAPALDGGLASRTLWRQRALPGLSRSFDVLFAPGGVAVTSRCPAVVMSRNMLPFEEVERRRFGHGYLGCRLRALREVQARSFSRADGVIFLSRYAVQSVVPTLRPRPRSVAVIPHGVDDRFRAAPRPARDAFSVEAPLRVLYVSQLSPYKHNLNAVEAVARLRAEGVPLTLELVGGADREVDRRGYEDLARRVDPAGRFVRWTGAVPHAELPARYHGAELFLYTSSCENMPNTLVEAMAAGLPIACSDRGPMPEVLGGAGVYLDPEDVGSIVDALRTLATAPRLRDALAARAYEAALGRSWHRCAAETFAFLRDVTQEHR